MNDRDTPVRLLNGKFGLPRYFTLFLLFLKVNVLTTSGPASVGMLYKEAVGKLMTESDFVESVGFSSVVPGSEAMKLAMFVGYAAGGVPGAIVAVLGTILPPTVMMLVVITILDRLHNEAWLEHFVDGLMPAVTVLITVVAWEIIKADSKKIRLSTIIIAVLSLVALLFDAPAPLVLIGAGILEIVLFR